MCKAAYIHGAHRNHDSAYMVGTYMVGVGRVCEKTRSYDFCLSAGTAHGERVQDDARRTEAEGAAAVRYALRAGCILSRCFCSFALELQVEKLFPVVVVALPITKRRPNPRPRHRYCTCMHAYYG